MKKLTCPHCGHAGDVTEFTFMYESTIYVVDNHVEKEERDRPVLVVCPKCKQGFFLEDPYGRFKRASI